MEECSELEDLIKRKDTVNISDLYIQRSSVYENLVNPENDPKIRPSFIKYVVNVNKVDITYIVYNVTLHFMHIQPMNLLMFTEITVYKMGECSFFSNNYRMFVILIH